MVHALYYCGKSVEIDDSGGDIVLVGADKANGKEVD
jgi:hypothetical protein